MRLLPLFFCLALAGCANAAHDLASAPAASAPAATAAASPPPAAMQARAAANAAANASAKDSGKGSDKTPPAAAKTAKSGKSAKSAKSDKSKKSGNKDSIDAEIQELAKQGPVTRTRINAMCWMKYEKGRRDLPLEKRADLVNKCVDEALKDYPLN